MKRDVLPSQFQSLDFKTKNYGEKEFLQTSRAFCSLIQVWSWTICKYHSAAILGNKYLTVVGNSTYKKYLEEKKTLGSKSVC